MSSPRKKLRTLRRMLAFRVVETERKDQRPGISASRIDGLWRERKALEWAVAELEALHPESAPEAGPREGCVYPPGQRCRGADRCQFPARCERTTVGA